ncbi:MAG: hypothetical protein WHS44_04830 [Fimbriimonadales bacterium]|nr:MAG: hypothetical protein KatS3mg018_2605 [Fimbriimonadales bacterium]
MKAEQEIRERLARVEQELSEVKQQLRFLLTHQPPTVALQQLAELWGIESSEAAPLSLSEARKRLAQGLPTNWGSRLLKRQRSLR